MAFCDHCAGQRFDRAQVLRTLRETRKRLKTEGRECTGLEALELAIQVVRGLDTIHLELLEEMGDDTVVH